MKYLITWLVLSLVAPSIVYLSVSFVLWDFMFLGDWRKDARFFYLLISIVLWIFASVMACAFIEDYYRYRRNK